MKGELMPQTLTQELTNELIVGEGRPYPLHIKAASKTVAFTVGEQSIALTITKDYRELLEIVRFGENGGFNSSPVHIVDADGRITISHLKRGILAYDASHKDTPYGAYRLTELEAFALLDFLARDIGCML